MISKIKFSLLKKVLGKEYKQSSAQTFVEYAVLLGVVVTVMLAMAPMLKRGTQGLVKTVADQIGNQSAADQGADKGYLQSMETDSATQQIKGRTEYKGTLTTDITEQVRTRTHQISNLGFSESQ